MAYAEDDSLEFDDGRVVPPAKIVPLPTRTTPEWLTGPADGLGSVPDPHGEYTDEAPPESLPQPVLRRPGMPLEPVPPPVLRGPGASREPVPPPVLRGPGAPLEPVPPPVPRGPGALLEPAPTPVSVDPASDDEQEEGAESLIAEAAAPAPAPRRVSRSGAWAPVASSVPSLRLALPAEPEPFADGPAAPAIVPARGLPARDEDLPRPVAPPRPLAPLHEPWWVVALDTLRSSRPVQVTVALGLVALVALAAWGWPRGVGTTSLSELRRNPTRFDGRIVTVRGRVGDDIFSVGAGWAFYLVQGRDTIVAFTRGERPKPRVVITLKGQVSTGFLDGMPRQALFADPGE